MDVPNPFAHIPHYSPDEDHPVLFYGGEFSNFVGGPYVIESEQPFGPVVESYRTIEHFFQASKATNRLTHFHIREAISPWEAKKRGRSCLLRDDWEQVKYEVMKHGLRVKFANDYFREFLLATGNRFIAEESPTDFIWGILDAEGGLTGQNLLGNALMEIRDELEHL